MPSQPTDRRSLMAVAVSSLLHAAIGAWLWTSPVAERAPAAPRRLEATLRWTEVAPQPPPPVARPVVPERIAPDQKKKKAVNANAAPATTAQPVDRPAGPATDALATDSPFATPGAVTTEKPSTRPSLTPGIGLVMRLPEASDAEDTRGTTLHNEPADQPDVQAVAEYEAEKAGRKLSLDLAADVARAQQGAGRVPGFFVNMNRSLGQAAEQEEVKVSRDSEKAQTMNALGSFLDPTRTRPSDAATNRVADTAFAQNARIGNPALPGDQQQFNQATAQMFTRTESIKEGLSKVMLRAVVALTIDARGALADASIVERSGDRTFDESALHLSRKVVRAMPDSDDKALGTSWWRSRWVFTWEPPRMKVRMLDATPMAPPVLQ